MTIGAFAYRYQKEAEEVIKKTNHQTKETSVIYDRTGEHVLYELFEGERRKIILPNEIPDSVRYATIATEDQSFYSHEGFDFKAMVRALKKNIENREIVQGGSTITQQLARYIYLTREKTYTRKIKEIFIARELEKSMSKEDILSKYLNQINYGSNVYGIEKASEYYFDKKAIDLSYGEASLLAALPKAPTYYFPYGAHRNQLVERQKSILWRMRDLGLIDDKEFLMALQEEAIFKIKPPQDKIEAPHFVIYVIDQLEKEYGSEYVRTKGAKIITTLDYEMQKEAEKLLAESKSHLAKYNAENAALVAINPKNGEILAMVGSIDFFSNEIDGEVNVTIMPRQPGSSFKPIVYAEAFSKGYQPETALYDVRTNFGPDGSGRDYIPRNYNGKHVGKVSMRDALGSSLNVPAVKTLYLSGLDDTLDFAEKLGISTLKERNRYGLSIALGGGDVKLLELTSAYGVFANDGNIVKTRALKELEGDISPDIILALNENVNNEKINVEVARKINSVLSDNQARVKTFGKNSPLVIPGKTVAVKTGTTQDYRDAWAIGYTPSLVVGVWAGNNDNSPMKNGAAGAYVTAPIWNKFMTKQLESLPDEKFKDYTRVESNKFMITGKTNERVEYYNNKSGKKIDSPEKKDPEDVREKKIETTHSILHYVNRENPLTGEVVYDDSMYKRWEEAINSKR